MRIASPRCSSAAPEHRPVLLALALAVALTPVGCAGGRRAGHDDGSPAEQREDRAGRDAGTHAPARSTTRPEPVARSGEPGARATGTGALEVSVTWDDAPARLRQSPGRNACGASRSAPVQVHTLGGVAGAGVYLRPHVDAPAPAGARAEQPAAGARAEQPAAGARAEQSAAALLAVQQCRAWPRVVLLERPGEAVSLVNDDERRHELEIERLSAGLAVAPAEDATDAKPAKPATNSKNPSDAEHATTIIALPVVGSSVELRWPAPGIYRVAAADVEAAFVIVPDGVRAGVTTALGSVRFDDVPIGSYDIMAWHPPVDDSGAPITRQALVTVTAGHTTQSTIPLTWP